MGQKSKSTKVPKAMATMPENLNPSMEIVAPQLKMQSLSSRKKAAERHFRGDSPAVDHKYKSLYFDLQQKIEALTKENQELSKKLDVALGKIEVYEETRRASSDVLEKFKDVILISNLAKATETAMNLSSQAILAGFSSPRVADEPNAAVELQASAKRKKQSKGNEDN
ncbi:hypothetical protein CsSME_00041896 [Camellia sinensis var. sinensis]